MIFGTIEFNPDEIAALEYLVDLGPSNLAAHSLCSTVQAEVVAGWIYRGAPTLQPKMDADHGVLRSVYNIVRNLDEDAASALNVSAAHADLFWHILVQFEAIFGEAP